MPTVTQCLLVDKSYILYYLQGTFSEDLYFLYVPLACALMFENFELLCGGFFSSLGKKSAKLVK
jgi:hypothetical protein